MSKDVIRIPCEACDLGNSVKNTTSERRERAFNVEEGWYCDVRSIRPKTIEYHSYFCPKTEDITQYKLFKQLKFKNDAGPELISILRLVNIKLQLLNKSIRWLVIDGEKDWGVSKLSECAREQNIEVILSAPYN